MVTIIVVISIPPSDCVNNGLLFKILNSLLPFKEQSVSKRELLGSYMLPINIITSM
jgi:hypothetical protein